MDLYQVCLNYAPGSKWAHHGGHMFNRGLYRENMKKLFVWNHKA